MRRLALTASLLALVTWFSTAHVRPANEIGSRQRDCSRREHDYGQGGRQRNEIHG